MLLFSMSMDYPSLRKAIFEYRMKTRVSELEIMNWSYPKLLEEISLLNQHIEEENKKSKESSGNDVSNMNPSSAINAATKSVSQSMSNVKIPKV